MLFAIGMLLVFIGASAADSENVLFPVICMATGLILIRMGMRRQS